MTGFEDLDDDVLYLILYYLHLRRAAVIRTLRLTSRRLRDVADAVTHRTVSLIDDESHEQITYRLAERLTDPTDRIRYYVRDLRVTSFKGDAHSYCLNAALIVNCLHHIQRLDSFSWDCDAPIPSNLLNDLQRQFPRAQLCANVNLVGQALLPIPALYRLDVSIPCAVLSGEYSTSLFNSLKRALLQLHSLRHLGLDSHHDPNVSRLKGAVLDRLQIPLEPGDKFPALISLSLRSKSYVYDIDHCKTLLTSVDCGTLQSLILCASNPITFFTEFRHRLPRVTHLDISYASDRDDPRNLRLEACASFIASIVSLRSLVLRVDDLDVRSGFSRSLTEVHGPTLHHLRLQSRQENTEGPLYRGNLRKFLFRFTSLQSLYMAFPDLRSYHRCHDCEGYTLDDSANFSFVPPLPSLQSIQLSIRAPFSEKPLYSRINAHAHCAICHLWTTFVNCAESQLETLGIRFWRWKTMGRLTRLSVVVYDSTKLSGMLEVRARHDKGSNRVNYEEVFEEREGEGRRIVRFKA